MLYFQENTGCTVCYSYWYKSKTGLCYYCNYQLMSFDSLAQLVKIYREFLLQSIEICMSKGCKATQRIS
jgi:hypothetical protein